MPRTYGKTWVTRERSRRGFGGARSGVQQTVLPQDIQRGQRLGQRDHDMQLFAGRHSLLESLDGHLLTGG